MAWKFFNVGKANEEIARLETELCTAEGELSKLRESGPDNVKALTVELESVTAQLTEKNATNQVLANEIAGLNEKVAKLEALSAGIEAEVETRASAKALTITQAQGQPPVAAASAATSKTRDELWAQYATLESQADKSAFYEKHRRTLGL